MNKYGKSDSLIVPGKLQNKVCKKAVEAMEGRGLTKGESVWAENNPDTAPNYYALCA